MVAKLEDSGTILISNLMPRLNTIKSVVILCPAYNEEEYIAETIRSLLKQTVRNFPDIDYTIVVIPNNCTDRTASVARRYPVEVFELHGLTHGKSEAMNLAWHKYGKWADLVITVDADTMLEDEAVMKWVREFESNRLLRGSSARFTMQGKDFLTRLQKMDFAKGIDISLRRGWTNVLAGAASAFLGSGLRLVNDLGDRSGPWTYASTVEDFEVTYQLRRMGYKCHVSPHIRAYTDAMPTWDALRGQRLKWTTGTIRDLVRFGLNKVTFVMWMQQLQAFFFVGLTILFVFLMAYFGAKGQLSFSPIWLIVPLLIALKNIKNAARIPENDHIDIIMAGSVIIYELFSFVQIHWFVSSWSEVIKERITGKRKDLWKLQYAMEAKSDEKEEVLV